jgi:hypothetical protein
VTNGIEPPQTSAGLACRNRRLRVRRLVITGRA